MCTLPRYGQLGSGWHKMLLTVSQGLWKFVEGKGESRSLYCATDIVLCQFSDRYG